MAQYIVHSTHPDLQAWSLLVDAASPNDALAKAAALSTAHHSPGTLFDLVADQLRPELAKQWTASPMSDIGPAFIQGKVTGVGPNVPAVLARFRGC